MNANRKILRALAALRRHEAPLSRPAFAYHVSRKVPRTTEHPEIDIEDTSAPEPNGPRIRCPICNWSPRAHDRWACECGHIWNTFHTGGVCPACLYQWTVTACLSCQQWSPHSDWYTQD